MRQFNVKESANTENVYEAVTQAVVVSQKYGKDSVRCGGKQERGFRP